MSALFEYNVAQYGAIGNGVHDDTTDIQAAIDAVPAGGTLWIPRGVYRITAPLVISAAIAIRGAGVFELYGSLAVDANVCTFPLTSPYITGTIIRQETAATDAIQITTVSAAVHLSDFGILFDKGNNGSTTGNFRWTNTGHGIAAIPAAYSGKPDQGLFSSYWDNISVYGHDGNHYGFVVTNTAYNKYTNLHAFGGGTMEFRTNSAGVPGFYGNSQIDSLYGVVCQLGLAHGIYLNAITGEVGLLQFNRPQTIVQDLSAVVSGTTSPTSAQKLLAKSGVVVHLSMVGPDFESSISQVDATIFTDILGLFFDPAGVAPSDNSPYRIWLQPSAYTNRALRNDMNQIQLIDGAGEQPLGVWDAILNKFYGYDATKYANVVPRIVSDTPTPGIAAGTGAGTSPTLSIAGSDMNGTITLTTGSGPSGSAATIATVTFHTAHSSAPRTVTLTPGNAAAAALSGTTMPFVDASTISATTFALKSGSSALAGATDYIWFYEVLG